MTQMQSMEEPRELFSGLQEMIELLHQLAVISSQEKPRDLQLGKPQDPAGGQYFHRWRGGAVEGIMEQRDTLATTMAQQQQQQQSRERQKTVNRSRRRRHVQNNATEEKSNKEKAVTTTTSSRKKSLQLEEGMPEAQESLSWKQ